jgi:hypothetical protein
MCSLQICVTCYMWFYWVIFWQSHIALSQVMRFPGQQGGYSHNRPGFRWLYQVLSDNLSFSLSPSCAFTFYRFLSHCSEDYHWWLFQTKGCILKEQGKGKPSQLHNWMHSTEMCLPYLIQPLWIGEVRWPALIDAHVIGTRGAGGVAGVNCLAQGQNGRFFHLAGSRIRTINLSVTVPTLLTARLPAARKKKIEREGTGECL